MLTGDKVHMLTSDKVYMSLVDSSTNSFQKYGNANNIKVTKSLCRQRKVGAEFLGDQITSFDKLGPQLWATNSCLLCIYTACTYMHTGVYMHVIFFN